MLTFLHASDFHFGAPYRPEIGEVFLEMATGIDADAVVLSGDFTQRARIREFEAARAWIEKLPDIPRIVTPGNHDVPLYRIFERIFTPFRNYREYIADELDSVTTLPGAVVVSLASAAPHHAIVNGRIRPEQIDFARRAFRSADPEATRVVVAHHHFAPAPDYEGDKQLPRAREILDDLNAMGVELLLGGHLHRAYIGNSLDVHPGADPEHGIVIVQSGTTTSGRGRAREEAKNTFNVVRIADDHLEVTHYMYFEENRTFAPFSTHAFPRRADRFFPRDPAGFAFHDVEGEGGGVERPAPRLSGARPGEEVGR